MQELTNGIYPEPLQLAETFDEIVGVENNYDFPKVLEVKDH